MTSSKSHFSSSNSIDTEKVCSVHRSRYTASDLAWCSGTTQATSDLQLLSRRMATQPMCVLFVLLQLISRLTTASELNHTLYFLAMLPYRIPEFSPDHQPAFLDGPSLAPAVYLAVDQINNRTDVLGRYKIELIESNGGCDFDSVSIISFVSNVLHGDKQIVGIVGPTCTDGVRALSTLTHREEVSLTHIHIASSPLFLDRNHSHHQNTFATTYTNVREAIGISFVGIVKENGWSRFGIFREENLQIVLEEFMTGIDDYAHNVTFSVDVTSTNTQIPIDEPRNMLTRVILAFTSPDTSRVLACLAFHNNITYPTYQWIFYANYTYEEITVLQEGVRYSCEGDQLKLEGSVIIECKLTPNEPYTHTVSGLNYFEYLDAYMAYSEWYNDEYGYNETVAAWANPVYDATWALALALNNSETELEKQNLSLSNYRYGHEEITRVIREEMFQLRFQGTTGQVHFERDGGFNDQPPTLDIFQVEQRKINHVKLFINHTLVGTNDATFISDMFPEEEKSIHIILAFVFSEFAAVALMMTILAHVLNTRCRHKRSVKASSPRVNHFAFIGCYLLIAAIITQTLNMATPLNEAVERAFCNSVPWLYNIGLVLVLATVCVKTWRLYAIFSISDLQKPRIFSNELIAKDKFIMVVVAGLSAVPVILCLFWSIYDPFEVNYRMNIQYSNGDAENIHIEKFCDSRWGVYWKVSLITYDIFLIGASVILALSTQRKHNMELFNTRNVAILAYLLALTMGLCVPTSIIAMQLELSISVQYSVLAVWLEAVVYLCIICLFVPPLLPVLKEQG